jgi:hypothetical protein
VPEWEDTHIVSDLGRVATLPRTDAAGRRRQGCLLKQATSNYGHKFVILQHHFRREIWFVHRLVLFAFVGPPGPGLECCHWNDVPDDNRLTNLRWDTRSANARDAVRNGAWVKTECKRGHPMVDGNIYTYRDGSRECRRCRLDRNEANRKPRTREQMDRQNELARLRRLKL